MTTTHFRTCTLCEAMCGLTLQTEGGRVVSIRGDADAIASHAIRPAASSICASIPMRPASRPVASSIWPSSLSVISTSPGVRTLGSMTASSRSPACSTTATRSR